MNPRSSRATFSSKSINDVPMKKMTSKSISSHKTLQLYASTPKLFYLRQLWTYHFCIYHLIKKEAHMYVWSKDVASRRSQTMRFCLLQLFRCFPPNIKRMIAFSDSCEGQIKNKNITKLLMVLVKATQLKEIHFKFLEPGHAHMD